MSLRLILPWLLLTSCSEFSIDDKLPELEPPVDSDVPADWPEEEKPEWPEPEPEETDLPPVDEQEEPPPPPPPPEDTDVPVTPVPPVADAGPDQLVAPLDLVRLDGTASYDPMGLPLAQHRWSLTQRPVGSSALLILPAQPNTRFTADLAGTYVAQLEVRNVAGLWDPTPDTVTIEAVPNTRFYVQLTWNAASDLDLHVIRDGSSIFQRPGDACYCNRTPSWYAAGTHDDPSLDIDDIDGHGPETTTIEAPGPSALFHVKVHYYGQNGSASCSGACPASRATLDFYVDGLLAHSMQRVLRQDDEVWNAATVDGATLSIAVEDTMSSTTRSGCY